jgi:hypothetical protein
LAFEKEPEDCQGFLNGYDWLISEHVGYHELAGRYILPTGRWLASRPVERMVYAETV